MSKNTITDKTYKIAVIENMVMDSRSRKDIASYLGVKVESLAEFCNERNVRLPSDEEYKMSDRRKVVGDLTIKGYSRDEIANILGVKLNSLVRWAISNSITLPPISVMKDSVIKGNVVILHSVPLKIADEWRREANSRNIGISEFASQVLVKVHKDNLYSAILD